MPPQPQINLLERFVNITKNRRLVSCLNNPIDVGLLVDGELRAVMVNKNRYESLLLYEARIVAAKRIEEEKGFSGDVDELVSIICGEDQKRGKG